jgi:hypothetical protein
MPLSFAPPYADDNARAFLFVAPEAALGEKKRRPLLVSQLRTILEVVLPLRMYTIEEVLALVAWVQQRNHQAIAVAASAGAANWNSY